MQVSPEEQPLFRPVTSKSDKQNTGSVAADSEDGEGGATAKAAASEGASTDNYGEKQALLSESTDAGLTSADSSSELFLPSTQERREPSATSGQSGSVEAPRSTPAKTSSNRVHPDKSVNNSNSAASSMAGTPETKVASQVGASAAGAVALRHVSVSGDLAGNSPTSNLVKTSTYTWYDFLPKFLIFQFMRPANVYFLVICILQMWDKVTITSGRPTMALPFAFILMVQAIKDIIEDAAKHKADNIQNSRIVHVYDPEAKSWAKRKWYDVKVGQVLKILNKEFVPADIVVVGSSDQENNGVFINTKSLDGETDLKIREVPNDLIEPFEDDLAFAAKIGGKITCQAPTKILTKFEGAYVPAAGQAGAGNKMPLSLNNCIFRGCQIKQTEYCIGIAVYTGRESRIQMNFGKTKRKVSTLARWADGQLKYVALYDLVCCMIASASSIIIRTGDLDDYTYSVPMGQEIYMTSQEGTRFGKEDGGAMFLEFVYLSLNYMLIFAVFIPISLLVTIDMVKFIQMFFIQWDRGMYYEKNKIACQVRAPDLNESLGMVNHVFSDKTGTLTCNIMEFRKCSIGGVSYGKGTTQIGRSRMRREGIPVPPEPKLKPGAKETNMVNFIDDRLQKKMESGDKLAHSFMLNMSLNHEVTPDTGVPSTDNDRYGGPSPDEIAFVWFGKHMGYELVDKPSRTSLTIDTPKGQQTWEILDVLQFTSTRKRSSVIARRMTKETNMKAWADMTDAEKKAAPPLRMFSKGADNVMAVRLREGSMPKAQKDATFQHVEDFSQDGLRILVICQKEFKDYKVYDAWSERYAAAKVAETGRDEKMAEVMAEIEVDLDLVGVTAIEDKLQNGVPEAIEAMRHGGIKVWVLTGDKVDTAINIGYACEVMNDSMVKIELTCKNKEVKAKLALDGDGRPTAECLKLELQKATTEATSVVNDKKECVIVLDTYFLSAISDHAMGNEFLKLASLCKSVVAARVSPDQKGEIVRLVRQEAVDTGNDALVTLAIGDGANDVTMIKEAHIGVGIDGLEGKQAVNNSDYAIGQFKYLQRLLFVHGRWSYRRMSVVILYMFYKNCLLVLPQWMFGIYSQFSGQNFYLEFPLYQLSNIAFSAFPILAFGILDQDVVAEIPIRVPSLYKDGNTLGIHYSGKTFWLWMLDGTWSAAVCTFFGVWSLGVRPANGEPVVSSGTGRVGDMWYLGCIIHLSVTIVQNLRLMIEVRSYNWLTILTYVFSISAWFILMTMFANLPGLSFAFASKYAVGMDKQVNEDALLWITVCLSVVVSILPSLVYKAWRTLYRPPLYVLTEELQKENYLEVRPFTEYWCGCGCFGGGARAGVESDKGQSNEEEVARMRAAVAAARAAGKPVDPFGAWQSLEARVGADSSLGGVEMMSVEEKTAGRASKDDDAEVAGSSPANKFDALHDLLLKKKY